MTHASVPADQREVLGISDTLVSMISLIVSMDSNSYFVYESETQLAVSFYLVLDQALADKRIEFETTSLVPRKTLITCFILSIV